MVKVKLALDHSNTSLVTVLLDREHREIKNLYSLRQSKEATITGKPSTLSIFHTFPATYHLALLMVCTFHSSLDMHDAAHTMMISDIDTSAWLINFCHKAIKP